jgi:hypothetical protein
MIVNDCQGERPRLRLADFAAIYCCRAKLVCWMLSEPTDIFACSWCGAEFFLPRGNKPVCKVAELLSRDRVA